MRRTSTRDAEGQEVYRAPGADSPGAAPRLALAGFLATAVAFGPARNGYGLFLPEIREDFGLSTGLLGLIASGLYAGYLLALLAVGVLATLAEPRPFVLVGLASAASGWRSWRSRRTSRPGGGRSPGRHERGVVVGPYNDA